jgi:hypothetical protein
MPRVTKSEPFTILGARYETREVRRGQWKP